MEYKLALRMSPLIKHMTSIRRVLYPLEKIPTFSLDDDPTIRPNTMRRMINFVSQTRKDLREHVQSLEVNDILPVFELSRVLNNMMIFYTLYQVLQFEKHISSMFFSPSTKPAPINHIHDVYAFQQWKAQISETVAEEFCNFIRYNSTSFRIETYPALKTKHARSVNGHEFIWHIKEFVFFGTLKDCEFPAILPNVLLFDVSNTSMVELPQLPLCERIICRNNNIYTLPELPQCLEVDCSHNMILRLPDLPKCVLLNCSHNLLRNLPHLPCARIIECDHNSLVDISNLPVCDVLWCSTNRLTTFPSVPSITDLDCSHNNIQSTKESPVFERCTYLDCSYNQNLTDLPNVPNVFQCYHTNTRIVPVSEEGITLPDIKSIDKSVFVS